MNRVVIVICDSLRTDLITSRDAPFLSEFGQRSARFAAPSSSTCGLATHVPPNRGGEVRDRPLPLRRRARLLDVPLGCARLLPRGHLLHLRRIVAVR